MTRTSILLAIVLSVALGGCAEEQLICAELTGQVRVCRPDSEVEPCDCAENILSYRDGGAVTLMSMNGNAHETIDEWPIINDMLGVELDRADDQIHGYTWTINLYYQDGYDGPYTVFYGWRVIARFDEQGTPYDTEFISFWGIWLHNELERIEPLLTSYAESIELLDE